MPEPNIPGTLYMIPCPIAEGEPQAVLPAGTLDILRRLDRFIVENARTARRFLGRVGTERPIQQLEITEFNEHSDPSEAAALAAPLLDGRDAGFLSEAGAPGVADPGAAVAAECHRRGVRVVPLAGPSSPLLALMASGQCGQSFAFAGYLPVKPDERRAAVRRLERRALEEGQSQLFIETPYRNLKLYAALLEILRPETRLTVASGITGPQEFILTLPVRKWRGRPAPPIDRMPAIFIVGSPETGV